MSKLLSSNVWKLYLLNFINWFLLIIPVIVLFYQENGLSLTQIMTLQAFASIVIVGIEIPSGYFADYYGRKTSLVIGSIFGFMGTVIYALSSSFLGFLGAEFFIALGAGFISGANSALLYDTMLSMKQEKSYKAAEGKMSAYANFSEGIASIFGGFLAIISLRTPLIVESVVVFTGIFVALSLHEPQQHATELHDEGKKITHTLSYIRKHPFLHSLMWYAAFMSATTLVFAWFAQPYFKMVGLPLYLFGAVWAFLQFVVGYFSFISHKIEVVVGRQRLMVIFLFLLPLSYVLVSTFSFIWTLPLVLIFYIVRGIQEPMLRAYINELIPSNMRATILSIKSFLMRIVFSVFGPFLGWIADVYSFNQALYVSAFLFLVFSGTSLAFLRVSNKKKV